MPTVIDELIIKIALLEDANAKRVLARFTGQFAVVTDSITNLISKIRGIGSAMMDSGNYALTLTQAADRAKVTAQEIQRLRNAMIATGTSTAIAEQQAVAYFTSLADSGLDAGEAVRIFSDNLRDLNDIQLATMQAAKMPGGAGPDAVRALALGYEEWNRIGAEGLVETDDQLREVAEQQTKLNEQNNEIANSWREIQTVILPALVKITAGMAEWIKLNKEWIATGIQTVAEGVAAAFEWIGRTLGPVVDWFGKLVTNTAAWVRELLGANQAMANLGIGGNMQLGGDPDSQTAPGSVRRLNINGQGGNFWTEPIGGNVMGINAKDVALGAGTVVASAFAPELASLALNPAVAPVAGGILGAYEIDRQSRQSLQANLDRNTYGDRIFSALNAARMQVQTPEEAQQVIDAVNEEIGRLRAIQNKGLFEEGNATNLGWVDRNINPFTAWTAQEDFVAASQKIEADIGQLYKIYFAMQDVVNGGSREHIEEWDRQQRNPMFFGGFNPNLDNFDYRELPQQNFGPQTVEINQNFFGNTDPDQVYTASERGVQEAFSTR